MAKLDPRKLMEQAVEVMRQSVAEHRADGKASPKVGAVLWRRDGTIQTACRGELRDGDHAEYTLLERKNRDSKLDGAVLFTTLEPCAPGSRRQPKLDCAERIVLARIREVYVGIEDPDPTVDRRGISYLQDRDVTVHMFDRDLQGHIHEANREFIAQAMERAAAAQKEKKPRPITLSPLEDAFARAVTDDFSTEALDQYRKVAQIDDAVGSASFHRRLALQGLLKEQGRAWVPTGFGLLLFGKEPRLHMRQAGLLGTIHFSDGREEPRDFDGPQVLAPAGALQWLRDKLPDPVDRTEARRKPVNEALFELAREGIVNALVHRDYGIEGAKCQLLVAAETITVKSPGRLLAPIKLEHMQSFTAPMLSRNPILHYVFAQMDLAEERGLGLKSMKQRAEQAGLPLPAYAWEDPYLVLTLYRSAESASRTLRPEILEALNHDERVGWQFVASRGTVVSSELMEHLGCDERKAQRVLKKLIDVSLIRRVGKGPATRYEVIRS
ncbi:MAG: ATP-binding protein [Longimicrobiales bacterium]|nr:ATP-binding protein [Longimicrobiales bacterium]